MLKSVVFNNILLFQQNQTLTFNHNGAHFLIGANGAGKSSVFELVRRCNNSDNNLSLSDLYDKRKAAYVICEYVINDENDSIQSKLGVLDIHMKNGPLYSMLFVDPENHHFGSRIYRAVLSTNEDCTKGNAYVSINDMPSPNTTHECQPIYLEATEETNMVYKLLQLTKRLTDKDICEKIQNEILLNFRNLRPKTKSLTGVHQGELDAERFQFLTIDKCSKVLVHLSNYVIFLEGSTPRRQHSQDTKIDNETEKLLGDLLQSEHVDHVKEKKLFSNLIFPQEYEFEIEPTINKVSVRNKNSQLLRESINSTSEGIVNAKLLSLLLCNASYKTIFLQSIDMGMHPSMIGKFRDMILKRITNKVVIVSSHHPSIISPWTLPRTFICRFQRIEKATQVPRCENTVVHCLDIPQNAMYDDQMKKIPFSAYVLFVEGRWDKLIIRYLLQSVQEIYQTDNTQYKEYEVLRDVRDQNWLCAFITLIEIISQDGSTNHYRNAKLCGILGVPSIYVYDKAVFISKDHKLKTKVLLSYLPEEDVNALLADLEETLQTAESALKKKRKSSNGNFDNEQTPIFMNTEYKINTLLNILERNRIFMWTLGKLDDVVMSAVNPSCDLSQRENKRRDKNISNHSQDSIEHCVSMMIKENGSEMKRFVKFIEKMARLYFTS